MGILDRFVGDNRRLTRPDFSRFEHIELDFSGTKLRFIDAEHTAMFPINNWPEDLDIYDIRVLEQQDDGSFSRLFYVRGWDFLGKKNIPLGGCTLSSFIFYFPDIRSPTESCLNRAVLEKVVVEYCHDVWGSKNSGASLGSLGKGNYVYPISGSDLEYENINGVNWCRFMVQWKADPPEVFYACPISDGHVIFNSFKFSAYRGTDFYSPETNLEQTCFDVVNDYMSEFYIELSSRSLAEKAEATDPV